LLRSVVQTVATAPVDGLADVADLDAVGETDPAGDPADQRALEQLGEKPDELLTLGRRPRVPVRPQRELGRGGDIDDLLDDGSDRPQACLQPIVCLGIEDAGGGAEEAAELLGRRCSLCLGAHAQHTHEETRKDERSSH
jgi:hypothetical protein